MIAPVPVETLFAQSASGDAPQDLVTVAVSLHNYARFLPECLDSVAAQRHPNLDLIVVDDASDDDDSAEAARAWMVQNAQRFGQALVLRHCRNNGLAQARNTGFAAARGEYVFVLDADNALHPRAIGRLHGVLSSEPFDAAYTQLEYFDGERRLGDADIWHREHFATRNYVDAMALVCKRAWRDVGGYTPLYAGWEDYDFWCKFVEHGFVAAYVPEFLCRYRIHGDSMLRTESRLQQEQVRIQITLRHAWLHLG